MNSTTKLALAVYRKIGTLPWTAPHERRSMLYKFAPDAIAYGRQPHDLPPAYEAIEA